MSTLKIKRENGKIFCPLADSWHIETPEEKVRQEYIKILVEDYGYSLDQMAQEIKVNNSQRGQGKARADIVIWKSKQDKIESKAAFIVVECKAENVRIREEDYYQGYNYASWAGASFFVTTNEKETKYFNVDKDYLPKELVEVVAIPTAEEALNDKKVNDIDVLRQQSGFIGLTQRQKEQCEECYRELTPYRITSVLESGQATKQIGAYNFVNDAEKISEAIVIILYMLRCCLAHGDISPDESANEVYKYAYEVLCAPLKKLK